MLNYYLTKLFRSAALPSIAALLLASVAGAQTVVYEKSRISCISKQMNVPVEAVFRKFSAQISFDPARAESFYDAVRRYWPGLADGALVPAYAGIRPKLTGPGQPAADFRIDGPAEHGIAGLVNLFGIESPGLTACLALAEEAAG
mgnify:CR=1 FL=1